MNEDVGDVIKRQKEGSRICLVGGAEIVSDFIRGTQGEWEWIAQSEADKDAAIRARCRAPYQREK